MDWLHLADLTTGTTMCGHDASFTCTYMYHHYITDAATGAPFSGQARHLPEVKSCSTMDNGQQPNGTYGQVAHTNLPHACMGAALIIHPYIINGVQGVLGNMRVLRDGHLNAGGG